MPTYSFYCEDCEQSFEVRMMMSEYTTDVKCPNCQSGLGVSRDFSADSVTVNGGIKTLGSLADKHDGQFSADYKQHLLEKTRGKKKKEKSKLREHVESQNNAKNNN